jgi:hypothetical protein
MKIDIVKKEKIYAKIRFEISNQFYELPLWSSDVMDAILENPDLYSEFIPDYIFWDDYDKPDKKQSVEEVVSDIWLDDDLLTIYISGLSKEELEDAFLGKI